MCKFSTHSASITCLSRFNLVDAERFIVLLRREPFDYTEWRKDLYKDVPLDEFLKSASEYRNTAEA